MADTSDLARLTTFQHHIDDMRNLVMCKICLKPLYEPFILSCGHTYCYGCLRSWFCGLDSRRKKKNCPDCRAEVRLTPSPNYILRDLVHMFINRAELLPEDETVGEHEADRNTEADLLAKDKDDKGLFQGVFRNTIHLHVPPGFGGPLQDISDGVLRCPICHWELEDGMCNSCGYEAADDDDYPDFSDDTDGESITIDEQSIGSNDISSGSYGSDPALTYTYYGPRPTSDAVNRDAAAEISSELGWGTPDRDEYDEDEDEDEDDDEDEDEMESFIDDHDEDEPIEVDDDNIGPAYGANILRRRRYWQLSDESDGGFPEDEDENDEVEEGTENEHRENHWHPGGPIEVDNISEDAEENESDIGSDDQHTNYDNSDEDDRDPTPVPASIPFAPRRRPLVISSSDDEDEDTHEPEARVGESAHSEVMDSENSDDTATPPQSSAFRRQRLDNHRKRRQTPETNTWRSVARGGRGESTNNRHDQRRGYTVIREARPGSQIPGRVYVNG